MNYCSLLSQIFPLNPTGHSHEKVLIPSIQVPLFWQGLLSHSFMSVKVDGMDYLILEFYTNMFLYAYSADTDDASNSQGL